MEDLAKGGLYINLFYPEDRQKIDKSHKKIRTISVNNKLSHLKYLPNSIAHKWIKTEKPVYISLDIETGGENCRIILLSAQIFRMVQHNSKMTSEIEKECFDEYVMPSKDSIRDERLFQIHSLHRNYPRVKETNDITEV